VPELLIATEQVVTFLLESIIYVLKGYGCEVRKLYVYLYQHLFGGAHLYVRSRAMQCILRSMIYGMWWFLVVMACDMELAEERLPNLEGPLLLKAWYYHR
jgi:hypothetical protein